MTDNEWDLLLGRIAQGKCTPFLGAGISAGVLPLGAEIARDWAVEHGYPLDDSEDLARVAQFLGVDRNDQMHPKEEIVRRFGQCAPPDFNREDEPHVVLAKLPLPLYMTTNYDGFLLEALKKQENKVPRWDICRWNKSDSVTEVPSAFARNFKPDDRNPVVFHLHGTADVPESMVLTEDDYLDFLVAVSRDDKLLPHQVKKAFTDTSLLFIGYGLTDWDFRVLHRGMVMAKEGSLRRLSVTVQVEDEKLANPEAARTYLDSYFGTMNVRVYWGPATKFVSELWDRWNARNGNG